MAPIAEKTFPRGGKKPALAKKSKGSKFSLFKKPKKKVKRVKKKEPVVGSKKKLTGKTELNLNDKLEVKVVDDLRPPMIQEGMLILGIVNRVTNKAVNVMLPGGVHGIVSVVNVSEFYVNLVRSGLEVPILQEMFKVGDVLPVKVLSPTEHDPFAFNLTTDPAAINKLLAYSAIEEGFILVGNVKSEEEHGYVIDFGISEARGFLRNSKIPDGNTLQVGQIVKCAVIERLMAPGSCNVQLTMLPSEIKLAVVNRKSTLPIHCFVPGFQFKISFKEVMKHGLQVNYRKDNASKGFVHEDYLPDLFPELNDYLDCDKVGTLLYVKPLVNFPVFMIEAEKPYKWRYQQGEIVSGTVVKTVKKGVFLKIGEGAKVSKCFAPIGLLPETKKIQEEDAEIHALYPVGKNVEQIRLGRNDLFRRFYIGAADKASLKEKYFSITDIKCGDVVPCQIISIENNRATVQIGQSIIGIVAHRDMTDVPLRNPQLKFKPGQRVKARVLEVNYDTKLIFLTMKPTLVKSTDPILKSYQEAEIGDCYTGSVVKVQENGLLVLFFNKVKGFLYKRDITLEKGQTLKDNFTEGQLVKVFIIATDHESRINLSFNYSGEVKQLQLKVGKKYNVKVAATGKDFLNVNVEVKNNKWVKGIIPIQLLSKNPELGAAYSQTYKEGEAFEAYCVYKPKDKKPRLSPVWVFNDLYEGRPRKELKNCLQVGEILPFMFKFKNTEINTFYFNVGIPDCEDLEISCETKALSKWSKLKFLRSQIVHGKILDVDERVKISFRLDDVWDKELKSSFEFLRDYIIDMERLIERQKVLNRKYLKNVSQGKEVKGTVKQVEENGALIQINSSTEGFALGEFSEGQLVTGKVVWIDGVKKIVYVNSKSECVAEISEDQNSALELDDGQFRARIVYTDKVFVIGALKGRGKGRLVYLPLKRHINDFFPPKSAYSVGDVIKLHVTRLDSDHLLGIDKDVYHLYTKKAGSNSLAELKESVKKLSRKRKGEEGEGAPAKKVNGVNGMNDLEILLEEKLGKGFTEIKQEILDEDEILNSFQMKEMEHDVSDEEIEIKSEEESYEEFNDSTESKQRLEVELSSDSEEERANVERKNEKKNEKRKGESSSSETRDLIVDTEINGEISRNKEDGNAKKKRKKRNDSVNSNEERIELSLSSDDESEEEEESRNAGGKSQEKSTIANVGFNWDVLKNPDLLSNAVGKADESSDDEEDDDESNKKQKKKKLTENEKRELAKQEEERLRRIEEELMNPNRDPQTVDDFDRAVLANPNSSALWLKYMAFHLQATEIEKARAVARRALKNISFREEQEKLNIWTAFLNLENLYGNDESFRKVQDEALQFNDPFKIHLHIFNMYAQGNKIQDAERLGQFMLKKYKNMKDVWREVAAVYYSKGKLESARNVLQKAMASLDKKDHIELISKFAQLENKFGSSERAQTLYETVLTSFPKRVDVWCAYIDMMVKSKQIELARQVLERATSQTLPPKKMKILFKKFIEFEEAHGDAERVEKVRQAAVDYIKNVASLKSN